MENIAAIFYVFLIIRDLFLFIPVAPLNTLHLLYIFPAISHAAVWLLFVYPIRKIYSDIPMWYRYLKFLRTQICL